MRKETQTQLNAREQYKHEVDRTPGEQGQWNIISWLPPTQPIYIHIPLHICSNSVFMSVHVIAHTGRGITCLPENQAGQL